MGEVFSVDPTALFLSGIDQFQIEFNYTEGNNVWYVNNTINNILNVQLASGSHIYLYPYAVDFAVWTFTDASI
jgi:hypothetical protein